MKKTLCMQFLCLLLLCLLPACALGVVEGVIEEAPPVAIESMTMDEPEASYMPDGSYYAGYGDWYPAWESAERWVESRYDGECYHDVEQRPRMTSGEAERAKALLEAYQAGMVSHQGESILNKMEDVIAGVYALDPDDYDGEQVYVILPGPCMTDEQILAVIDAYAQLGLAFDPYALSERNCARGGGIETNRFFSAEEQDRYLSMAAAIRRGVLDVSGEQRGLVFNPKLDARYFCGLPDFSIKPYRSMTDEELVSMLQDMGVKDESGQVDFDDTERRSREALRSHLSAPLSMQMTQVYTEGGYVAQAFNARGDTAWIGMRLPAYGADFTYRTHDGVLVYAHTMFDGETHQLVNVSAMHSREWGEDEIPAEGRELTQEEILAAIDEAEEACGRSGLVWHAQQETTWTNWGECRILRAQLEEELWMTAYIGTDDGRLHGLSVERGALVETLPQDDMPVNG